MFFKRDQAKWEIARALGRVGGFMEIVLFWLGMNELQREYQHHIGKHGKDVTLLILEEAFSLITSLRDLHL